MKCIIDTNVQLLAGTPVSEIPDDQVECAQCCIKFINSFIDSPDSKLVLDTGSRVLKEYKQVFKKFHGERSLATEFFNWVCRYLTSAISEDDYICLNEVNENCFKEYPPHENLKNFDPPDRKFIALANAHKEKPPIIEGADSKWWSIKDSLLECGISVSFLCEKYIKQKFEEKMGP